MANVHADLALIKGLFSDADEAQMNAFYTKVLNKHLSSMPEFAVMMGLDPNAIIAEAIVSKIDEHLTMTAKLAEQFVTAPKIPTPAVSSVADESKTSAPSYASAALRNPERPWTQVTKSTHRSASKPKPKVFKSYPPRRVNEEMPKREVTSLPAITGLKCCYVRAQDRFLHALRVGDAMAWVKNDGTMPDGVPVGWTDHGDGWYGHIGKSMTIHKYNPDDQMFSLHMEWDVDVQDYRPISHAKFVEEYDSRGARF
jgi:hypothetical protein